MVGWVAGEFAYSRAEPVVHGQNTELRDGILFEEFEDILLGVLQSDDVAIRSHVFL